MKPLDELNNVERARILHQLFPAEIPAFIEFTANLCEAVHEEKEKLTQLWDNGLITLELWLSLASSIKGSIELYGKQLEKKHRLFTAQLFDGYHALFTAYALEQFTVTRKHPNPKFVQAVSLLFL